LKSYSRRSSKRFGAATPMRREGRMSFPSRTAQVVAELARLINVWRENGLGPVRPAVLRHWARHTAARTGRPPASEEAIALLLKLRLASVSAAGDLTPAEPLRMAGGCSALDRLEPPLNQIVFERMLDVPSFADLIETALAAAEVKAGVAAVSFRNLAPADLSNPAWYWLQQLRLAEHEKGRLVLDPCLSALIVTTAPARRVVSPEELEERLSLQKERACLAEDYVYGLEKLRLAEAGAAHLADDITLVARIDVAAGYDILSFEVSGAPRYIEVKSCAGRRTSFHLTPNERGAAGRERFAYWLAWVGWAMRLPHEAPEVAWFQDPSPLFDGSDPAWSVEPDGLLVRRVGNDRHLCERVD
jgi:hypothetical protein